MQNSENWITGFDSFIKDITGGRKMSTWGNSTIATKYVYQKIHEILDMEEREDVDYCLSRLLNELAYNYQIDTGKLIGEEE